MNDAFLIYHSWIADGSGNEPFLGWLRTEGAVIAEIGKGAPPHFSGIRSLDGEEALLSPGFIDSHGHSDLSVFSAPAAENRLRQGVTAEIIGNCGLSPFPITHRNREHLEALYQAYETPLGWDDFEGYANAVSRCEPAIHLAALTGHNTLRAAVCGYENIPVTHAETVEMRRLFAQALMQGSAGLSLGLLYVPGKFAETTEVMNMLAPLAELGKPLAAHLRSEGDELLESVDEMIRFQRECGLPKIHISHLKTALRRNWFKIDALLEKIQNTSGLTADRYPYTEGMTSLSVIVPSPLGDLTDRALAEALQSPKTYHELLIALSEAAVDWAGIRLADCPLSEMIPFLGEKIPAIAGKLNLSPPELVARILRDSGGKAMGAFGGMSPDNMSRILALPNLCCGSDENIRPNDFSLGHAHPRGFGSMPVFFNEVRKSLPLGETIRKMTALPAGIFGLRHRGQLRPGFTADLVLWDPNTFEGRANFASPHCLSEGVRAVWVDGHAAVWDQSLSSRRNGKMLRI